VRIFGVLGVEALRPQRKACLGLRSSLGDPIFPSACCPGILSWCPALCGQAQCLLSGIKSRSARVDGETRMVCLLVPRLHACRFGSCWCVAALCFLYLGFRTQTARRQLVGHKYGVNSSVVILHGITVDSSVDVSDNSPAAGFSLRTRIPCPLRIPCTFFAELSTQAVDDVIMPALTAITRLSTEAIHTHTHVRCPALSAPRVFYASPQATV
jgi:hypothetical protein